MPHQLFQQAALGDGRIGMYRKPQWAPHAHGVRLVLAGIRHPAVTSSSLLGKLMRHAS